MNRFDICDAFYYYAVQHQGGRGTKEYALLGRLRRMGYRPGKDVQYGALSEGAQEVYERLCGGESSVRGVQ